MSRLYKLTALVFLVLWVPITAHCHLEKVPGLEFLKCASDTPERSDCEGDGCQTVESGLYKISDNSRTAPLPAACVVGCLVPKPADDLQPSRGPLRSLSCAPPDLPQRWQFISRAAPPVRAPSSLS